MKAKATHTTCPMCNGVADVMIIADEQAVRSVTCTCCGYDQTEVSIKDTNILDMFNTWTGKDNDYR